MRATQVRKKEGGHQDKLNRASQTFYTVTPKERSEYLLYQKKNTVD